MKTMLPKKLQELVSWSVFLLGQSIKEEYGAGIYHQIEKLRVQMKSLRGANTTKAGPILKKEFKKLKTKSSKELHQIGHAFSLMLELVNGCEAAYRSYRLEGHELSLPKKLPRSIIFVLTAHPTEARSPECLALFNEIRQVLLMTLQKGQSETQDIFFHLIKLALRVPMSRQQGPTVQDEAAHIFSFALKKDILNRLVKLHQLGLTVNLRTWVGGDKDGHPGVNQKTLLDSMNLSRQYFIDFISENIQLSEAHLNLLDVTFVDVTHLKNIILQLKNTLKEILVVGPGDGEKIFVFNQLLLRLNSDYKNILGINSPELKKIVSLMWLFPAMVLPLEIREDSAVVQEAVKNPDDFAISGMLKALKEISVGLDAKWYVRGFVLSMVENAQDILNGIKLTQMILGGQHIPVVPLFENEKALQTASGILHEVFIQSPKLIKHHQQYWGGRFEIMLGYSDSSKENGVFPSRFLIAEAMHNLDRLFRKNHLIPIFFHGSGGSIERGGGSLKEQTQWWPKSALKTFKATTQGEMVARSFANPEILQRQVERIAQQYSLPQRKILPAPLKKTMLKFSLGITTAYQRKTTDKDFLDLVERATPYAYLNLLKIGSRPTRRQGKLTVEGLRAIPWILCWTQTRTLFPTWWGVGQSWEDLNAKEKKELKLAYKKSSLLSSFVKALGFTLAKVELSIWELYLAAAGIEAAEVKKISAQFKNEIDKATKFVREISGKKNLLWYRPWLQESIRLRSSMIHPLNMIQLIALEREDDHLLRESVTGIACGMLTTG